MKLTKALTGLMAMATLGYSAANAENMLINGDFEMNAEWRMWGTGGGFNSKTHGQILLSYDTVDFKEGKQSLKTTDDWDNRRPYIIQFIEAKDMTEAPYILSFWAKASGGAKGRAMALCSNSSKFLGGVTEHLNAGKDWKKYSVVIKSLPKGTEKVGIAFAATTLDKTEKGTLWVDDVVFKSATAKEIAKAERAGVGEAKEDGLTFHAPFDGSADAKFAIADGSPVKASGLTYVEGKFGKAVEIKGSAKLVYKGKSFNMEEGTISMWVKKYTPWSEKRLYSLITAAAGSNWNNNSMYFQVTKWNQMRLWTWNDKSKQFTVRTPNGIPYAANEWYHLVATYEDGNQKIYVNGAEIGYGVKSDPNSSMGTGWAKTINVGTSYSPDFVLNGAIDDLRFYDIPMDAEEVAELYKMVPSN